MLHVLAKMLTLSKLEKKDIKTFTPLMPHNENPLYKEWKDEIIFLHKIIPGSTDDSYGIYVAKLAGIPKSVVFRSKNILTALELKNDLKDKIRNTSSNETQLSLFTNIENKKNQEIITELELIDLNSLTPIKALNILNDLKSQLKR